MYDDGMKMRYEGLEVWQLSMELWKKWQLLRKKFPKEEQYKLTDQLDRSIDGIISTIVEGSAKRSNREFGRYLDISRGSTLEARNHFALSYHKGYISEQELKVFNALLEKIFFKEVAFQKWLFARDSHGLRDSSDLRSKDHA